MLLMGRRREFSLSLARDEWEKYCGGKEADLCFADDEPIRADRSESFLTTESTLSIRHSNASSLRLRRTWGWVGRLS